MSNLLRRLTHSNSTNSMSRMDSNFYFLETASRLDNQANFSMEKMENYYKIGQYQIKTFRLYICVGQEQEAVQLLNPKDIPHLKKNYRLLHIGSIHVVKPLTKLGLNKPVCVCLGDARQQFWRFSKWVIGIKHGPLTNLFQLLS